MTDRRLHPGNGRHVLEGWAPVGDEMSVEGKACCLSVSTCFLTQDPDSGARDRELLFGDRLTVIDEKIDGHEPLAFVRAEKDGYVGWLESSALGNEVIATHQVTVRTTFAYPEPELKTHLSFPLHMTSLVRVVDTDNDWSRIEHEQAPAWVPTRHLSPLGEWLDRIDAARALRGTHYLWAGNSGFGLDCSGLVSAAYRAAGFTVPGDSDLQEAMPGLRLSEDEPLQSGDLVFWKGHVAIATGPETIIHANAHHMMVVEEPLSDAVARIAATDTGPVTSRLRPDPPRR